MELTRKKIEILKTVLYGSYSGLSFVYTKQHEGAEKEGYAFNKAKNISGWVNDSKEVNAGG